MNILHSIHSANPAGGGVIEAVNQLTTAHLQQGHKVEIVCLDAPEDPWLRNTRLPIHALGPGYSSFGYTPRFVSWLRENRPKYDAVIVHGLWQYHGLGVRRALAGTNTPYVVFPHGMLDPWFKRNFPVRHLKKALYWRLWEHRLLNDAQAVLFTSEEERRLARSTFRPYRCQESVINLGTSVPPGDPAQQREYFYLQFPNLRDKRILLFLGRLHTKKGCELLIKAFAKVRTQLIESDPNAADLHLVMAGPCADAEYLKFLKATAEFSFSGEEAPITWTGMLGGDLKWGAFRAAEAFLLPSHQENFGFSVVEALACQVPVLISDKINIWREIADDRAGLIETDDFEGTVRLLRGWITMAEEFRQTMRISAQRCFTSRFEIEMAAANLIDFLEELADSTSPSLWSHTLKTAS
jgi:glycosyltransferase involved in cell wall biosynthesis